MNEPTRKDNHDWRLVVDGGGSKIAIAAVSTVSSNDTAPVLFHFDGTGSAHPSTWPQALNNLRSAIETVAAELKKHTSVAASIACVQLALAGAGRADDQARVIQSLRGTCACLADSEIKCCGDIEPLVDYHAANTATVAVILGTGSVVASRNAAGEIVRAGGWGPLLGDACSGGAIGLSALRYVTHLLDEARPVEQLCEVAHAVVGSVRSQQESSVAVSLNSLLIQTASDRTRTARLSLVVLKLAYESGNRTALELLEPHLADIVWQIRQVARRAGIHDQSFCLNFTGGVAENCPPLRAAIAQACRAAGLGVSSEAMVDPLTAMLSTSDQA